jgi:hypothetical protein
VAHERRNPRRDRVRHRRRHRDRTAARAAGAVEARARGLRGRVREVDRRAMVVMRGFVNVEARRGAMGRVSMAVAMPRSTFDLGRPVPVQARKGAVVQPERRHRHEHQARDEPSKLGGGCTHESLRPTENHSGPGRFQSRSCEPKMARARQVQPSTVGRSSILRRGRCAEKRSHSSPLLLPPPELPASFVGTSGARRRQTTVGLSGAEHDLPEGLNTPSCSIQLRRCSCYSTVGPGWPLDRRANGSCGSLDRVITDAAPGDGVRSGGGEAASS